MKAKELLIPRFEVIEEYPKCEFEKNEILSRILYATNDIYHSNKEASLGGLELLEIEKYPHLFRKLNWWENRKKEDMPKRLKSMASKDEPNFDIEKEEVYDIIDWDMNGMMGFLNIEKRQVCDLELFSPEYGYIPVD